MTRTGLSGWKSKQNLVLEQEIEILLPDLTEMEYRKYIINSGFRFRFLKPFSGCTLDCWAVLGNISTSFQNDTMNGCILTCEHDGCNKAISVKLGKWIQGASGMTFKHFKEPQFANENC